jgi:CubicO group peptidase (beta-lactamase class C family)
MNRTKIGGCVRVLAVCWLCIIASQGRAQQRHPDYSPLIAKYRTLLAKEMEHYHDAGMSIALVDRDSVVWCEGFGYYGKNKTPVTGHTAFHIGSICKTFTGLGVMQLQEDGKINIDSAFSKYVPAFRMKSLFGPIEAITVRSMLTHHAGIPDYIKDKFALKPPYFTGVLDLVNRDYATFPPGAVFSYSNSGFSLLGNLIEASSGMSYFDFLRQRILLPMEMNETGFAVDDQVPESVHCGYDTQGNEQIELAVQDAPAGCLYSTAYDMAKYIQTHLRWGKYLNHQVFDSSTLVRMMEVQTDSVFLDFGSPYGLAWRTYDTDGGLSIQHDGGTLYHRAEIAIAPLAGIGVVMLSNSASGKPLLHNDYDLMNEAMKIKGITPARAATPRIANLKHPEHNFTYREGSEIHFAEKNAAELSRLCGTYGTFGMTLEVKPDSNALSVTMTGNRFYLLPADRNEFLPAGLNSRMAVDSSTRFYFEPVNNGFVIVHVDRWGNHAMMAQQIEHQPLTAQWKNRLGSYAHDGVNTYQMFSDFSLQHDDGLLLLKAKFNMEMPGAGPFVVAPLKIINDSLAVVWGFGRLSGQAVQFIRSGDNGETMQFMGFNCRLQ